MLDDDASDGSELVEGDSDGGGGLEDDSDGELEGRDYGPGDDSDLDTNF